MPFKKPSEKRRIPPKEQEREKLVERQIAERRNRAKPNWAYDTSKLNERQHAAVEDLEDAAAQISKFASRSVDEISDQDSHFRADRFAFHEAIKNALRRGVTDHSAMQAYFSGLLSVGDKELVRSLKRGAESGSPRRLKLPTTWIVMEAREFLYRHEDQRKPSVEQIRRHLERRALKLSPKVSANYLGLTADDIRRLKQRIEGYRKNNGSALYKLLKRRGLI